MSSTYSATGPRAIRIASAISCSGSSGGGTSSSTRRMSNSGTAGGAQRAAGAQVRLLEALLLADVGVDGDEPVELAAPRERRSGRTSIENQHSPPSRAWWPRTPCCASPLASAVVSGWVSGVAAEPSS